MFHLEGGNNFFGFCKIVARRLCAFSDCAVKERRTEIASEYIRVIPVRLAIRWEF